MQAPDAPARQWPWPVIAVAAPATVLLPLVISYIAFAPLQRLIAQERPASALVISVALIAWLLCLCVCVTALWISIRNDQERNRWRRYRRNLFIVLLGLAFEGAVLFGAFMLGVSVPCPVGEALTVL